MAFLFMDVRTWLVTDTLRQQDPQPPKIEDGEEGIQRLRDTFFNEGRRAFDKCAICHSLNVEEQSFGPNLTCILGSTIADGEFRYSQALKEKRLEVEKGAWSLGALYRFIEAPHDYVPDTRMWFPGLKGEKHTVRNLVHFLAWSCVINEEKVAASNCRQTLPDCEGESCEVRWILPVGMVPMSGCD